MIVVMLGMKMMTTRMIMMMKIIVPRVSKSGS